MLEPRQNCPLCGEQAKGFDSVEFGEVLKKKWGFKKSIKRLKEQEKVLKRVKFCPRCGSTNINFLIFYRPSIWKCLDCSYEGVLIVEDGKLADKIRERHQEGKRRPV
jgi:ribosomal protein L37AE/L43A